MLRDAATRFPATMQSSSLSLRPPPPADLTDQQRYNLQLGNISLSVAPPTVDLKGFTSDPTVNRLGNTLEAGVDGATTLAKSLWGNFRERAFQPLS